MKTKNGRSLLVMVVIIWGMLALSLHSAQAAPPAGVLKEGDKVPSVRELAARLAVNQNTILKVYNELCRQNVLRIERGDGTYVSSGKQTIGAAEKRKAVSNVLREAAVLAVQLELPIDQVGELLKKEYDDIVSQRAGRTGDSAEK